MADCEKLSTCVFFKEYENDSSRKLALKGFVNLYCKGDMQDECIRKKISALGGPEKVPVNMMPNGKPLSGTSDSLWPEEVRNIMSR